MLDLAGRQLCWMIGQLNPLKHHAWKGEPFEQVKLMSATEKGNLGEDFLKNRLLDQGYVDVDHLDGRRGHYDVSVSQNNKIIKFEVKVATQDVSRAFQFNGIRLDTRYTHLFCLGVAPNSVKYLIVEKSLLNSPQYRLVSMAKSTNAAFKLTRTNEQLRSFHMFGADIKHCFEQL